MIEVAFPLMEFSNFLPAWPSVKPIYAFWKVSLISCPSVAAATGSRPTDGGTYSEVAISCQGVLTITPNCVAVWRLKRGTIHRVNYWEIIADNLKKRGWSLGWVSAFDSEGRTIWIADAHRGDGKRYVVRADEKLTTLHNSNWRFARVSPLSFRKSEPSGFSAGGIGARIRSALSRHHGASARFCDATGDVLVTPSFGIES